MGVLYVLLVQSFQNLEHHNSYRAKKIYMPNGSVIDLWYKYIYFNKTKANWTGLFSFISSPNNVVYASTRYSGFFRLSVQLVKSHNQQKYNLRQLFNVVKYVVIIFIYYAQFFASNILLTTFLFSFQPELSFWSLEENKSESFNHF